MADHRDSDNREKRSPQRNTQISARMKRRLNFFVALFLVLFVLYVVGTLFRISVVEVNDYRSYAADQQVSSITIPANRGAIYDKNMEVLASSATVWTVVIAPASIKEDDKERIAKILSQILDLDFETVFAKTKKDNQYEIIKKKVEKTQADEVRKFISDNEYYSISLIEDTKRYYPQETLAAQVIGFTNADNNGTYGVEEYYNDVLEGTNGKIMTAVDGKGNTIPTSYEKKYNATDGNSLVLTIDTTIQHFAEQALENVVAAHNPRDGACAIVMNVKTGEIYAMANSIGFDLNDPNTLYSQLYKDKLANPQKWTYDYNTNFGEYVPLEIDKAAYESELVYSQWKNMATMTQYNPGSVFKVVTGSGALEEGIVNMNTTYTCSGRIEVADAEYRCHVRDGHGTLDFTGMVKNSCNPAFIWMGQQLGIATFNRYLDGFGITEKTGIDLPGEASSQTYPADDMTIVDLASESFGQSMGITPIQMLTAVSAVVNGGYLVQPYVVGQMLDSDGNVISATQTNVKRQVVSTKTSQEMTSAMEAMAEASAAAIPGYRIAGKSGTSQIKNETGSGRYVSSMACVAPADDPEIAVLVMVQEPTGDQYYGSKVAAPAVRQILADTLPYLNINPQYSSEEQEELETKVPSLSGKLVSDAEDALDELGLDYEIMGDGETVQEQIPQGGVGVADSSRVILYTEPGITHEKTTVPDLLNKSVGEAEDLLISAGLNMSIGSSRSSTSGAQVDTQSLAAGTEVEVGTVVTIAYSASIADG